MKRRLAEEGFADPAGMLAKEWGILPPKDGKLVLDSDVVPFGGDSAIQPKTVEETRRLMAEQTAAGLPPGQGLPPDLVRAAGVEPPAAPPPDQATPANRAAGDDGGVSVHEIIDVGPRQDGPADWAQSQTQHADRQMTVDEEREYQNIRLRAAQARTPEERARVRAMEHAADLPVSARLPADWDRSADPAEHAAGVERQRAEAESATSARDEALLRDHVAGRDRVSTDEVSIGAGGSAVRAAGANENTRQVDENGVPRYIAIEDERGQLWKSMPQRQPIGQPAASLEVAIPGISDLAYHPTAQNASAGEVAAGVAKNREASGLTSLTSAAPVAPLSAPHARIENGKVVELGPLQTVVTVELGTDADGRKLYQESVVEARNWVDIHSGPGPARELPVDNEPNAKLSRTDRDALTGRTAIEQADRALHDGKITQAEHDATVLRAQLERTMLSGEDALSLPPGAFDGQNVLVIGGGPTAQWAGSHSFSHAASLDVAATMPRPKGTAGKELDAVEAHIRDLLADPNTPPEALAEARDQHHAIVSKHIDDQMQSLRAMEQDLASGNLTDRQRADTERSLDALHRELDPFIGSRVDRNAGSLHDPAINHMQLDIAQISKTENGKCLVTYVDGTQKVYDRVIPGIGQNDGVPKLLERLPPELPFVPVIENGRPVGLMSDPPGVTIAGAAALSKDVLSRVPDNMKGPYLEALFEWTHREDVSSSSRGIGPGMENVADSPALMQLAKTRTPEERQQLLNDWLAGRIATGS